MKSLAESLVDEQILTVKQVQEIHQQMAVQRDSFVKILLNNEYLEENKLAMFLAKYLDIPFVNLAHRKTDKTVIHIIPEKLIREGLVFPLFKVLESLTLAMVNPLDFKIIQEIEEFTKLRVEPVAATLSDIQLVTNKWFGASSSINALIDNLEKREMDLEILEEGQIFRQHERLGPINKLAHLIITSAVNDHASDVHLESKQDGLDVRFRLDGVLHKRWTLPLNICQPLISTIKILAKLDVVEKRLPLDGSFRIQTEQRVIDIRVSSYPMIYGEKLVLRLLDQEGSVFDLEHLGLNTDLVQEVRSLISKNYGIMLVTGPTGSGKTTTLYSILNEIKSQEKNIVTIEDPVEYHIPLINQSEINPKCGLTFSRGLRSVLRQDPDVILIGEIRDRETAEIAFQAALTGHLVFSTLHTNDTASSIARLVDMGVEPYLISSVLVGVLSQRLVRKICSHCKDVTTPGDEHLSWAEMGQFSDYMKGKGCKHCRGTGYYGRTGVFELLSMSNELKRMINDRMVAEIDIRHLLQSQGYLTLKEDGLNKVRQQITTLDEVVRVVK